jgi:SAM-dependent methyltransferase
MDRSQQKQYVKQLVRRVIGEPYVGKRLKMRRLSKLLPTLGLKPFAILDAGSEDATFVYWLADSYPAASVTAVDTDADAIAVCQATRPSSYAHRVTFRESTFSALEPDAFDLITAFDVLEHIVDDRSAVADLGRALRPGGTLLVHVPRDRWRTWSGVVHRVPDSEAWRINPGHVRHGYDPAALRELLTAAGLVVLETQTWVGRWGVLAHAVYERLEHPLVLRLLSVPVTDLCARLDRRSEPGEGNTVFARAVKPPLSRANVSLASAVGAAL